MEMIALLEQLANTTHTSATSQALLASQTPAIRALFEANDSAGVRKEISGVEWFAHEKTVAQA